MCTEIKNLKGDFERPIRFRLNKISSILSYSFILVAVTALAYLPLCEAATVNIQPKNLLLFKSEFQSSIWNSVVNRFPDLSLKEKAMRADKYIDEVASQILDGYCRKQQCEESTCLHATSRKLEEKSIHGSIEFFPIRLLPNTTEKGLTEVQAGSSLKSLEVNSDWGAIWRETGVFLTQVTCTNDPIPADDLAATESDSIRFHWKDLSGTEAETAKSGAFEGIRTQIVSNLKATWGMLHSAPIDTAIGYGTFVASGMPMGMGLSTHLSSISKSAFERAHATKSGIEHVEMRTARLLDQWEKARANGVVSDSHHRALRGLFDTAERGVSLMSTDKSAVLDRIEAILSLPTHPKPITPQDLEHLHFELEQSGRSVELIRAIDHAILGSVAGIKDRNMPYLLGPPGTGKTSIIKQTAQILGHPYCIIKFGSSQPYLDLFGAGLHSGGAPTMGMFAKCLTEQYDPVTGLRLTKNVSNPIIFFDEFDKTLNTFPINTHLRQLFLHFFNNEENSKVVKLNGLSGSGSGDVEVDLSQMIFFAAGNDPIVPTHPDPDRDGGWDLPLKSRLNVVEIPPVSLADKRKIAEIFLTEELTRANLLSLKEESKLEFETILSDDEEQKEPGVRVLKDKIKSLVGRKKAESQGYRPYKPKLEQKEFGIPQEVKLKHL